MGLGDRVQLSLQHPQPVALAGASRHWFRRPAEDVYRCGKGGKPAFSSQVSFMSGSSAAEVVRHFDGSGFVFQFRMAGRARLSADGVEGW
jgi:hypothetical protein